MKKSSNKSDYELLRLRAWDLHLKNWKQRNIAEALGVQQSTISKWVNRAKTNGIEALKTQKPTGAASKLSKTELANLKKNLMIGASYHGFPDNKWTNKRVQELIKKLFKVNYSQQHVGRILKTLD